MLTEIVWTYRIHIFLGVGRYFSVKIEESLKMSKLKRQGQTIFNEVQKVNSVNLNLKSTIVKKQCVYYVRTIERLNTPSQNQNKPKMQNMSPNFGYMVQKCQTKVQRIKKKILYYVLFCKSRLSKMASTRTNKIEKRTPLPNTNF